MLSVPGLIRRARTLIDRRSLPPVAVPPAGPVAWTATIGDHNWLIRVWSPDAWTSTPETDRPRDAAEADRPGWWATLEDTGPSPELFAHWRALAADSEYVALDPDGYPVKKSDGQPFKYGPFNPALRRGAES